MSRDVISQLSLGHVKAESELNELEDYFITTPTYINAKNETRRKTYYIGQRGAGKTALFKKLADDFRDEGEFVILNITPDDFSYDRFNDAEHDYSNIRVVYGTVWHYTLIAQMFKSLVDFYDDRPYLKTNKENIEILRQYLQRKDALTDESFLTTFLNFFGEFTSDRGFNKALRVGGGGDKSSQKRFERLRNLAGISQEMSAFDQITTSHPVCLFIDELDTGWDNSKEATNFIHGLFYAVRQAKKLKHVKVFVSLRSDMYNDLSSILPDPEKMREEIERFSWNPKTLRGLIAKRIIANYPLGDDTNYDEAISTVFEAEVLDYVIDHTLQRPREVIQFCTDALNEFNNRISYDQHIERITLDIVQTVEPAFSRGRFEDICKEYEHQYPGLGFFLACFENLPMYYSMESFADKVETAMLRSLDTLGGNSWLGANFSTGKLLEILFEIGFIKLYSLKDDKYLAYYEGSFLGIENVPKIKIHDVFVSALKCH
jgi:hypothetical protein